MTTTDRTNGRSYQLVKVYRANGSYMDRRTLHRYDLIKRYI